MLLGEGESSDLGRVLDLDIFQNRATGVQYANDAVPGEMLELVAGDKDVVILVDGDAGRA